MSDIEVEKRLLRQERVAEKREKEVERKSKELEKEVKNLEALVAELAEGEEVKKIKTKNCKTLAEQKNEKSKDKINNLREVKALLRDEIGHLNEELEDAKMAKTENIKHEVKDEKTNPNLCLENERLNIQIKEMMDAEEQTNPDFSTIAKFQTLKSELETYKLLESVFYST